MKILHTSDWHLGHRLHEQPQLYEQKKFLEWLIQLVNAEGVDLLLVAGDIFDTGYPSSQSMELFYSFLAQLYRHTKCNQVVMIAGNHDAPGTINAPGSFVRNFDINLVGKATENIDDEILYFDIEGEKLIVAAVPFLRDRDIRRAIAGEYAGEIYDRYKKALTTHYNEIAERITKEADTFAIAMGHLFAVGGQPTESENRIYVGGLGDIAASDFPQIFDYVALGHLHRQQKVDKKEQIRYSGSPYPLSFSEAGEAKKVVLLETSSGKLNSISEIDVPTFRQLYIVTGTMEQCRERLIEISKQNNEPEPWVEVILNDKQHSTTAYSEINEVIKELNLKVLKVINVKKQGQKGIEQLEEEDRQLNDLKPDDVFKKKCEQEEFNLGENAEILDAFYEILSEIN